MSYVLDIDCDSPAQAATAVPNPGIRKFNIAYITATGLVTIGTLVTAFQTNSSS